MAVVHDYYPTALRDSGLSGLVSLSYSVSPAGVPVGIVVTKADRRAFARPAVRFLSDWRFKVPPNWTADGGPTRRFKARVRFQVIP